VLVLIDNVDEAIRGGLFFIFILPPLVYTIEFEIFARAMVVFVFFFFFFGWGLFFFFFFFWGGGVYRYRLFSLFFRHWADF